MDTPKLMLMFLMLLGCKSAICENVPDGEDPCAFDELAVCWGVARCVYDPLTGEEVGHNQLFARCAEGDVTTSVDDLYPPEQCDPHCVDALPSTEEIADWPCANPPPSR